MSNTNFTMRVWGSRGSIPTPGPSTLKYGGNTSCLEVRCGNELLVFDAGTGIRELGVHLKNQMPLNAHIFFSHLHWDHIQGFPFFIPFFAPGNNFTLYAEQKTGCTLEGLLSDQMKYPYFPVPIPKSPSELIFHDIESNQEIIVGDAKVKSYRANHPDGCLAYRIEYGGKTIVYSTDTEHSDEIDESLCEAARDADVFIYDCNYTEEEYEIRRGWGHSTWVEGVKLAKKAGAKKLILWHHDPLHNDDFIDELQNKAREAFPDAHAAFEGMEIKLL